MQYIQDACLISLFTNSIFRNYSHDLFKFTWDRINNHSGVFSHEYNVEDARFLLQLSLMTTAANFAGEPLNLPSHFIVTPLIYDKCPMHLVSNLSSKSPINDPAILGYVLYSERNNTVFVIFTGTSNICMASVDLEYTQTELIEISNYIPGLKGHKGVYSAYQSIRKQLIETVGRYIYRDPRIVISGHSLGAALSQLCSLDLVYHNPIHYSFAAPMIFNETGFNMFNRYVKNSYRVANISDLVVLSPLPVMPNGDAFFHVGNLICFQRNMGDYSHNHAMAYALEYNII